MTKKRQQYSREFQLEALQLWAKSGQGAAQIEQDLGLSNGRLYSWKSQLKAAGEDAFPGQGRQGRLKEEVRRRQYQMTAVSTLSWSARRGMRISSKRGVKVLASVDKIIDFVPCLVSTMILSKISDWSDFGRLLEKCQVA